MNIFRLTGDLFHLLAILTLISKIWSSKSCSDVSGESQVVLAMVYITRYIDMFQLILYSFYNTIMKIFFILSSLFIIFSIYVKFKQTYNRSLDTFNVEYLVVPCAILALIFNYQFNIVEILWTFSIYLEAVAILPQLSLLNKLEKVDPMMLAYLTLLYSYRGMYIVNWAYRYYYEAHYDPISLFGGVVQTCIFIGFFFYYLFKMYMRRLRVIKQIQDVDRAFDANEKFPIEDESKLVLVFNEPDIDKDVY